MKLLEKIEDAINGALEKLGKALIESLKKMTPEIIPHYYHEIKSFFPHLFEKIKAVGPKIKIIFIKLIGYSQHYVHIIKGKLHAAILYMRSEEFKKANKKELLLSPIIKLKGSFKVNPVKTSFAMFGFFTVLIGTKIITKEIAVVKEGLNTLRAPASMNLRIEEDIKLDLGTFILSKGTAQHGDAHSDGHGAPAKGDGHGAPAKDDGHGAPAKDDGHGAPAKDDGHGAKNIITSSSGNILTGPELPAEKFEPKAFEEREEIAIEVKLIFPNSKIKNQIESNHNLIHEIKHNIEHLGIPGTISLPLDLADKMQLAETYDQHLRTNEAVKILYKNQFSWEINQEKVKKPRYHLARLRQYKFTDVGLQVSLEETKRNRQVYFEFVIQTNNREGKNIMMHHEVEIKDHLMMNVEPIVPTIPLDDEGKRIIRDKVKFEINNFLKHHRYETEVEEVFIDYILAS